MGAPSGMHPAHPKTPRAHAQTRRARFMETFPWFEGRTLPPHARLELEHVQIGPTIGVGSSALIGIEGGGRRTKAVGEHRRARRLHAERLIGGRRGARPMVVQVARVLE